MSKLAAKKITGITKIERRTQFECENCGDVTDAFENTVRFKKMLCRKCFGKGKDKRPHDLNNLSGKEWAQYSKSVCEYPDTRSEKQRSHGACFPVSLAKQQIEIYTKKNQTVLDPFVGVGTTLDAASQLGRKGFGIDINKTFTKIARNDLKHNKSDFKIITGDARDVGTIIEPNSIDFILTSPPYGNLLNTVKGNFAFKWKEHSTITSVRNPAPYSRHKSDLGNLNYPDFLEAIEEVMTGCKLVLRSGSYAAWVVKDFRNIKSKAPLVNFHGDVIRCAEKVGFTLWDIRIYDQTKFRPLVCLGYPSRNYYLNIGHSYILVFRKQ